MKRQRLFSYVVAFLAAASPGSVAPQKVPIQLGPTHFALESRIGGDSSSIAFHQIAGIAAAPSEFYVVDYFNHSIRAFDYSGRLRREFGRQGSGPGEFVAPARLRLSGDTLLSVDDLSLRRTTWFTTAGRYLTSDEMPTRDRIGRRITQQLVPLRSGTVVGYETYLIGSVGSSDVDPNSYVILIHSDARVDTLATIPLSIGWYRKRGQEQFINAVPVRLGLSGGWAVSGDSMVAIVDGQIGVLRAFKIGDLGSDQEQLRRGFVMTEQVNLGWTPRQIDPRSTIDTARSILVSQRGGRPADYQVTLPTHYGLLGSIIFDDQGRIWISESDPTDPSRAPKWSIVANKQVIAVVTLNSGFRLGAVVGDRLVGSCPDESGIQRVCVLRGTVPPSEGE